ncbi:MAG: hypothetical protein JEZ07_16285 [Phycisphaerae bacterium]|nr:hypothetical protein [Phycisphaerae bacterium]
MQLKISAELLKILRVHLLVFLGLEMFALGFIDSISFVGWYNEMLIGYLIVLGIGLVNYVTKFKFDKFYWYVAGVYVLGLFVALLFQGKNFIPEAILLSIMIVSVFMSYSLMLFCVGAEL